VKFKIKNSSRYLLLLFLIVFIFSCDDTNDYNQDEMRSAEELSNGSANNDGIRNNIDFRLQTLTPKEYVKWVKEPENGLVKEKKMNELQFSLYHLPSAYMVCNEIKNEKISKQQFVSIAAQYEDFEYYMLKIEAMGFNQELAKFQLQSTQEYEERIKYFAFAMQQDIYIETENGNSFPCEIFHFERIYNIAPYTTFMLGFAKENLKNTSYRTIVLNEKIFNKGLLKFKWSTSALENVPQIAL